MFMLAQLLHIARMQGDTTWPQYHFLCCTVSIAKPCAISSLYFTCRQGRYNLDPDVKFFATPPVHGSLARYVDHPADFCFKMPDALSYEQGAMVEPLSNAGLP